MQINPAISYPCTQSLSIWIIDRYESQFNFNKNNLFERLNLSENDRTFDKKSNIYKIIKNTYGGYIDSLLGFSLSVINNVHPINKNVIYDDLNIKVVSLEDKLKHNKKRCNYELNHENGKRRRKNSCCDLFRC